MLGRHLELALLVSLAFGLTAVPASAAVDKVICVPWQGDVDKQHTAISGQTAQLKCVVKTTGTSAVYSKWVYGDGSESAITTHSGAIKYNVETTRTYTAAAGTPFTARLQVSNTSPFALVMEDYYLLKIEANEINARINVAIDTGLWWLYKQGGTHGYSGYPHTYDGSPHMTWLQTNHLITLGAPTASAVHAFGINGHKVGGDADQDPYVDAVRGGMNYLVRGYYNTTASPELRAVAISPSSLHPADNPDANANGYGIEVYGRPGTDHTPYQGGQIMDAIIASGVLPGASTGRDFLGRPSTDPAYHEWTYRELLQDMADMHAWGQWDDTGCNGGICGSWWYNWNYASPGDNSASQWPAIGMLPAQDSPWDVVVPQWVKTYNANWLEYSKCTSGANLMFGYNSSCGCAGDGCQQTTTSAMVQMIFAGQDTSNAKWAPAQRFIADQWRSFLHDGSTWGGYRTYGWYSFAKAMRLAVPDPVTQIVKSSSASFDWYYGDPTTVTCTTEANCEKGLAARILETQTTSGASTGAWLSGNLTDPPLTTAWMIITLRPTLFAAAPIACFSAMPNPTYADQPLIFDPSCSGHSGVGKNITHLDLFEWDWNNDGTYDESSTSPSTRSHAFSCASLPCTHPVTLRVTDDNTPALTATSMVNVVIANPPHPPVADAGGPYTVSRCSDDSLRLNGSASFDPNEGQREAGCTTCPNDTITARDWDLAAPLTFDAVNKTGATPLVSAAEIASWFALGSNDIALRVTDNTLLAYPGSGQPNLTNTDFGSVDVKAACMCNLVARAKNRMVQLSWSPVSGATYDIYRGTSGPNTNFTRIASGVVSTYATYLDSSVSNGTTYYYRVVASTGCGSKSVSAMPSAR